LVFVKKGASQYDGFVYGFVTQYHQGGALSMILESEGNPVLGRKVLIKRKKLEYEWIPTASIHKQMDTITKTYTGFWIAPGNPESVSGVFQIIGHAIGFLLRSL
jgi:hypothetical protein